MIPNNTKIIIINIIMIYYSNMQGLDVLTALYIIMQDIIFCVQNTYMGVNNLYLFILMTILCKCNGYSHEAPTERI